MAELTLARHGQSLWNLEGRWTGLTDIGLSDQGFREATEAGEHLSGRHIDVAFVSELARARQTLDGILRQLPDGDRIPVFIEAALNERDYGIFTGKNKQEVRAEVGDEEFLRIRRLWDHPIKGGQTLKDVHAEVVPFHRTKVLPRLVLGESILVVAHNNALRAYIKELEGIPDEDVAGIELGTAEVRTYTFEEDGREILDIVNRRFGEVH